MEKISNFAQKKVFGKRRIIKIFLRIENSRLTSIFRRALMMLVPIIIVGAVAYAMLNFPNKAVEYLITDRYEEIAIFLEIVYMATFGMFSMMLVVALAISYAMEHNKTIDKIFFYVITAIASFGIQLIEADGLLAWEVIGNQGCFVAILSGLVSSMMFFKLDQMDVLHLQKYTVGMDAVLANAIQSIFPTAITVGFFALLHFGLLTLSGGKNSYMLWKELLEGMFAGIGDGFGAALLYTVLVHIQWILGIHGSHMMESVALGHFSMVGEEIIFSKSFFDTYVVMGGCGTSICVLLGIFLVARKKRLRNVGKLAFPAVIFNVNEILNFGVPITLNPILAIPFIGVSTLALVISYTAVSIGLIPPIVNEIPWTMPVIISGYKACGSVAGSILQIVIIFIGVIIYMPFIRLYENIYDIRMQQKIKVLVEELQDCEKKGENPNFLHRMDDIGMVARMLLQEMKTAIHQKQLHLVYQPQVDNTGKYVGAEALLRWEHQEYGFIYPPLIIYIAKEGGILPELERIVFDTAIESISKIRKNCRNNFKISVNITAHSFHWEIEKYIAEKLKEYQVPAEYLWLEITEQDMLTNSEMVIDKIEQLKKAGHKLLIDDFGMGHTSLIYLQSEKFDVVKLDGSLIYDINDRVTKQKIVASVIGLARKLNVRVVAEYVETQETCNLLKELGCDWYQGYLFGKPESLEKLMEKLI